jgi:hypothetical protein
MKGGLHGRPRTDKSCCAEKWWWNEVGEDGDVDEDEDDDWMKLELSECSG